MPANQCINVENNVNMKAFLKLIRFAEHANESDRGYYKLFGGKKEFTDTSIHPLEKPIEAWGHKSTAAGAYQILYGTWKQAKNEGAAPDFSPASQDKVAMWVIQKSGAMRFVLDAKVEEAIAHLRLQWTSLPGAAQQEITMGEAKKLFSKYVAEFNKQ